MLELWLYILIAALGFWFCAKAKKPGITFMVVIIIKSTTCQVEETVPMMTLSWILVAAAATVFLLSHTFSVLSKDASFFFLVTLSSSALGGMNLLLDINIITSNTRKWNDSSYLSLIHSMYFSFFNPSSPFFQRKYPDLICYNI